jgi:ribosome-associated translation inhibitor RaiA
MNQPVKIQFINCQSTPAIESRIHERIEKLERHFSPLINAKVTVEKPHRSKKHGLLYRQTTTRHMKMSMLPFEILLM